MGSFTRVGDSSARQVPPAEICDSNFHFLSHCPLSSRHIQFYFSQWRPKSLLCLDSESQRQSQLSHPSRNTGQHSPRKRCFRHLLPLQLLIFPQTRPQFSSLHPPRPHSRNGNLTSPSQRGPDFSFSQQPPSKPSAPSPAQPHPSTAPQYDETAASYSQALNQARYKPSTQRRAPSSKPGPASTASPCGSRSGTHRS